MERGAIASLGVIGLAASTLAAGTARADDAAAAQALFDDGKRLFAAGRYDEACPKFEESERLDPAGGTILHAGLCNEARGKTATAWAELEEALSAARRDKRGDREKVAREHLDALAPRLSRVTIVVTPDARRLEGLSVALGGRRLEEASWGVAIPVDPGEIVVEARARGHEPLRVVTTVEVGASSSVTMGRLVPTRAPAQPERNALLPASIGLASLGAASLAVSLGTGIVAAQRAAVVKDPAHCDRSLACDEVGLAAARLGKPLSIVSPVTLGVGIASLGAGIGLAVYGARSASATRAALAPVPGGAIGSLSGTF
jgi:hypothetical protein